MLVPPLQALRKRTPTLAAMPLATWLQPVFVLLLTGSVVLAPGFLSDGKNYSFSQCSQKGEMLSPENLGKVGKHLTSSLMQETPSHCPAPSSSREGSEGAGGEVAVLFREKEPALGLERPEPEPQFFHDLKKCSPFVTPNPT